MIVEAQDRDLESALARAGAGSPVPAEWMLKPCLALDLSAANVDLRGVDPADPVEFGRWIAEQMRKRDCDWAAGGYDEDRAIYAMSPLFGGEQAEPRSVHLGLDMWLPAGTAVRAVLDGSVHSLGNNAQFGDYGPTVILEHDIGELRIHSLHGHLAARSLAKLTVGDRISKGQIIGRLGEPRENLGWVPHLHFQLIRNIGEYQGDFPGVCARSQREPCLRNCPDPARLLPALPFV